MGLRRESEMRFTPRFDRLILRTRLALTLGFGGLLVIIALAGLDTLRVLRQIRANEDQIRQEFLFRNHVLNNIRSDLYLSGTYVRDYLLEPDFERAESYRSTLEKVRTENGCRAGILRKPTGPGREQALCGPPARACAVLGGAGSRASAQR